MYYIVHAYLAFAYKTKLREGVRGVHAITHHITIHYLVKTKKLAQHLYEQYLSTLQTTAACQNTAEAFDEKAYAFAQKYDDTRELRETFTYNTTPSVEAYHAERAIAGAEEFVNTVRQLMSKR